MDSKLIALSLGGLLALGSFLTKPAMGDEANKRTEVQFSAPVEIPGKVLAPGKYVFELADRHSQHTWCRFSRKIPAAVKVSSRPFSLLQFMLRTPPTNRSSILKSGLPEPRWRFVIGFIPETILAGGSYIPTGRVNNQAR